MVLKIAQAFEGLALPPRVPKDPLLFVAQFLHAHEVALQGSASHEHCTVAQQLETQFRAGGTRSKFLRPLATSLFDLLVKLFEILANLRHLLVGREQAKLLLAFHALAEVQHRLPWKMERHISARQCQQLGDGVGHGRGLARLLG